MLSKIATCTKLARESTERKVRQKFSSTWCGGVMGPPVGRLTVQNDGFYVLKTVFKDLLEKKIQIEAECRRRAEGPKRYTT